MTRLEEINAEIVARLEGQRGMLWQAEAIDCLESRKLLSPEELLPYKRAFNARAIKELEWDAAEEELARWDKQSQEQKLHAHAFGGVPWNHRETLLARCRPPTNVVPITKNG